MMKKALIVQGGWAGHDPMGVALLFKTMLEGQNFEVEIADTLEVYADRKKLKGLSLIVPHWTMGELTIDQLESVLDAIASGVGVAGVHAGMADAFHDRPDWQWMAGSQFVSHPGGQKVKYKVCVDRSNSSPIVNGVQSFTVESEFYYLQVDPCVNVLATIAYPQDQGAYMVGDTVKMDRDFGFAEWYFKSEYIEKCVHYSNKPVLMPAAYTKMYGKGKVFYCSVGHDSETLKQKELNKLVLQGMLWAAR